MGIVSRYFGTGATLGSMSAFLVLALVWAWMTIHLGPIGFLIGWIPAGFAAVVTWLVMTLFWGPLTVLAVLIVVALLALSGRGRFRETPSATPPEAAPVAPEIEAPRDMPQSSDVIPTAPSPSLAPVSPDATPAPADAAPAGPAEAAPAPPTPTPRSSAPIRMAAPRDDLNADAAAAGDTSHRRPQ